MSDRKVRILNIAGAMYYGVDEKNAGKVVTVDAQVADALVGMRFAEEVGAKAASTATDKK
jgi:hypothetical protein